MSPAPMPPPSALPTKPYQIAGKVQYHGIDVSGATIHVTDETHAGSRSFVSSEADSNFTETLANVSDDWADGDVVLIAATHNGRRGQKKITLDKSAHPGIEDIGTIDLQAHWGCNG